VSGRNRRGLEVEEVAPDSPDAAACLSRYFRELADRFDSGFDASLSSAPTLSGFEPPQGCFIVMRRNGQPIACGGFKRDRDAAYIKRMWVAGEARGLGLGRQLLEELEQRARSCGYKLIRLETERSLTEAQHLYRSSGYAEVPPFNDEVYAHHWFEKRL
jgi:ribosomal protein S18 acetylase RimI-like enzyme